MENRLEVQNIQGDELYMDLTPEELKELEQLKGGGLPLDSKDSTSKIRKFIIDIDKINKKHVLSPIYDPDKPFPLGIVSPLAGEIHKNKSQELNITKDIANQGSGF
ncbi:MAG: hypothetical protein RMX96_29310 [Nostoc sp. ChiSLP02]|nr:hypothetical protein [Nostoc sp. DedSLP05]MDZ8100275.1 hypothetical protein [Nostoc sp. DedSLP01]MDZ8188940.1 hypothetical protein [Nostoc sp. ChiSLP02]